jgi:hypothetical protein
MKKSLSLLIAFTLVMLPAVISAQDNGDGDIEEKQENPCIQAYLDAERETRDILWLGAGCLLGCLGIGAAYLIEPSPSTMNLLGKSPEYVAAYTDCYTNKGRSIQTNKALIGCIVGTLLWSAVSIGGNLLLGGLLHF